MADPLPEIGELIADARLVIAYGSRTGLLPDDSLYDAVTAAMSAFSAEPPVQVKVHELASALNKGLQSIAPMTLEKLGSTWHGPDSAGRRARRVAFAAFAFVVIFLTGYYTQIYSQANAILGQLTDIQSRNLHDKAERLLRLVQKNAKELFTDNMETNDGVVFETYLKYDEELLSLSDEINTYIPLSKLVVQQASDVPLVSPLIRILLAPPLTDPTSNPSANPLIQSFLNDHSYSALARPADNTEPGAATTSAPFGVVSDTPVPKPAGNGGPGAVTTSVPFGGVSDTPRAINPVLQLVSGKKVLLDYFLYASGIVVSAATSNLSIQINALQERLGLLGFWILPGLYGLLGATIFQLRGILTPTLPDPSLERLIVRLALGGFSGVGIFLVLGPAPQKVFAGSSSVIGPFGLAFLLGFSIDVFFTVLDRLVRMASGLLAQSK